MLKIGSVAELEAAVCSFAREQREPPSGLGGLFRSFSRSRSNRKVCLETSYLEFCTDSLDAPGHPRRLQETGRRAFDAGTDRPLMIVGPDTDELFALEEPASGCVEDSPAPKNGLNWIRAIFAAGTIALATLAGKK